MATWTVLLKIEAPGLLTLLSNVSKDIICLLRSSEKVNELFA